MHIVEGGTLTATDCSFIENSAARMHGAETGMGGAVKMSPDGGAAAVFRNCVFRGNTASPSTRVSGGYHKLLCLC